MADAFIKMHGLGNDFVVIDARDGRVPAITASRAAAIADRHRGIGCDQLILLSPTADAALADAAMTIWNADGSRAEACGNATRCVATLFDGAARIATDGGLLHTDRTAAGAVVDLPPPAFEWDRVPLSIPMDTSALPVAWDDLTAPVALSVGNPHVVFFVPDIDAVDLATLGPRIEHDPLFPERVNVNIAAITGADSIALRVWERGAGLTQACGTGACATAVAAIAARRVAGPVTVTQPGGALNIAWQPGGTIRMEGPATRVFDGVTDWSRYGA